VNMMVNVGLRMTRILLLCGEKFMGPSPQSTLHEQTPTNNVCYSKRYLIFLLTGLIRIYSSGQPLCISVVNKMCIKSVQELGLMPSKYHSSCIFSIFRSINETIGFGE
jgi:hypothetical protein